MPTLSRQQLLLLAEAAETMTKLREVALARHMPMPEQRIDVVPGVAALVVVGNRGLSLGVYALEVIPPAPAEGVGESKSPA
jgi:hypothetical protein